jgi:hypothetical protein
MGDSARRSASRTTSSSRRLPRLWGRLRRVASKTPGSKQCRWASASTATTASVGASRRPRSHAVRTGLVTRQPSTNPTSGPGNTPWCTTSPGRDRREPRRSTISSAGAPRGAQGACSSSAAEYPASAPLPAGRSRNAARDHVTRSSSASAAMWIPRNRHRYRELRRPRVTSPRAIASAPRNGRSLTRFRVPQPPAVRGRSAEVDVMARQTRSGHHTVHLGAQSPAGDCTQPKLRFTARPQFSCSRLRRPASIAGSHAAARCQLDRSTSTSDQCPTARPAA